jgi:hypothetical protein
MAELAAATVAWSNLFRLSTHLRPPLSLSCLSKNLDCFPAALHIRYCTYRNLSALLSLNATPNPTTHARFPHTRGTPAAYAIASLRQIPQPACQHSFAGRHHTKPLQHNSKGHPPYHNRRSTGA